MLTATDLTSMKEFNGREKNKEVNLLMHNIMALQCTLLKVLSIYVKGTKTNGREKSTFTYNSAKISHQAGKVLLIKVNLVIQMAEVAESYVSKALDLGGTKVVATPKLTLFNRLIQGKGLGNSVSTGISFVNSEAIGLPTSMGIYHYIDELEICEVVVSKKYKAVVNPDYDI